MQSEARNVTLVKMTAQAPETAPLFGWHWNESEGFPDGLRDLLATITCMHPVNHAPIQVGSGFIIQSRGNRALILTAAHVITQGVRAFQNSHVRERAHRTIPPDFLPAEQVSAATPALRVIVQNGNRVDFCRVAYVLWDEPADLAILAVVPQDLDHTDLFQTHLKLGAYDPKIGDLVTIAGFAQFKTEATGDHQWTGTFSRRPVFRVGKVTNLHPEGTTWVRSPCVEATMPTFSGMSGGPAFIYREDGGEPLVFGLLSESSGASSNPREHDPDAWDRSKATRPSFFSVLPRRITGLLSNGGQLVDLKFTVSGKAVNDEIDSTLFDADLRAMDFN